MTRNGPRTRYQKSDTCQIRTDIQQLLCNALIMFSAGHETTSTALTWLFYHLTQNMHVQDKLVEEINRVLQGQPIKHEHMKDVRDPDLVLKKY